jgi:hypothetical protein
VITMLVVLIRVNNIVIRLDHAWRVSVDTWSKQRERVPIRMIRPGLQIVPCFSRNLHSELGSSIMRPRAHDARTLKVADSCVLLADAGF